MNAAATALTDALALPDDQDMRLIAAAAKALFERNDTEFTAGGQTVTVQQARTKHLTYAIDFMEKVAQSLDPANLTKLVLGFADAQQAAIAVGANPNAIQAADVARAALGNSSLILTLAAKVVHEIPTTIAVFTNLTDDQVQELPVEEMILVVCKIFLVNYSFFTQSLRPILLSFVAALAGKMATARPV